MIDAENSDVFDVLAYIAFTLAPISRKERVELHRENIFTKYNYKQQEFLDFVLSQYVKEGVGELAQEKLPTLLEVKYNVLSDAAASLGSIPEIRDVFIGFQRYLYEPTPGSGLHI
jgi:type I restriction enzyme R subunit